VVRTAPGTRIAFLVDAGSGQFALAVAGKTALGEADAAVADAGVVVVVVVVVVVAAAAVAAAHVAGEAGPKGEKVTSLLSPMSQASASAAASQASFWQLAAPRDVQCQLAHPEKGRTDTVPC